MAIQEFMASTGRPQSVSSANPLPVTGAANASTNITQVNGTAAVTGGLAGTLGIGGPAAEDAVANSNPVMMGGVIRNTNAPVTLVAGDVARLTLSEGGALVVKPYGVAGAAWNANLSLTTTTATAIVAAAGASLKRHITATQMINTGASAVDLFILDGTTERWRITLPVNVPITIQFPTELLTTTNTALNVNLSAAGTVRFCAQGVTGA